MQVHIYVINYVNKFYQSNKTYMQNYYYDKKVDLPFEEIETELSKTLRERGFGILTKIDVKKTMKEKINKEYDNYVIFGACNPLFADKALSADLQIGLLLPCNIIAYTDKDGSNHVSVILPAVALGIANQDEILDLASEVEGLLKDAVDNL